MRNYLIANVLLIGVINIIAFKDIWILIAAASILTILAIYTIKEKNRLKQKQQHFVIAKDKKLNSLQTDSSGVVYFMTIFNAAGDKLEHKSASVIN
jgi:hypothetical protein